MNRPTRISSITRAGARLVQWLLASALLALTQPTLAADAVAPLKKTSDSVATKVAPAAKTTPQNVSPEDKEGVREIGPRTPPKKGSKKKREKSNKQEKKLKAQSTTSKELLPGENAVTKK